MSRILTPASAAGLLLLVGSVSAVAWWLNQPGPPPAAPPPADLDVVCTGRVDAAGQVIALEPAQPGRVAAVCVAEGASVSAGAAVLKLDAAVAEARLHQAEAAVEAAQVELDQATKDRDRFPAQIAARKHLVDAATARVQAAKLLLQQRKEQKSVTPLGKAEQEAMEAQVREMELLERAEQGQFADLQKIDTGLRVRLAAARLKAANADLDLSRKAVEECVVVAPTAGTVLRLAVAVGGVIGPGSPVPAVVFAPAGPLVVRAEIDQEFLGRVAVGQPATLQDENRNDGPTWTGTVKQVAGWVAQRRSFLLEPGELNDVRTVECVIALAPPTDGLVIGQRMRVRVGKK